MKWTKYIIPGFIVYMIQLWLSEFLSLNTIRPDFCVVLILYWSVKDGRFAGTVAGFIIGLLVDLSGAGSFFGLSPMAYSITGYVGGYLKGLYTKLSPLYFTLSWIGILCFQFLIVSLVMYQDLLVKDLALFWLKWIATASYTLGFAGILQVIFPIYRLS
ncbi:MAG TPA: rod shape-determining protein MreD [Candidatus Marinimicrobia bacterium]|nr:rod shape-determining protein MreD [Candidatus Neomarinimicrobiota bacterium]